LRNQIFPCGRLIQFKAMLREFDCDDIIETPIPKDVDANGVQIVMNARQRADFDRDDLQAYKDKDKMHCIIPKLICIITVSYKSYYQTCFSFCPTVVLTSCIIIRRTNCATYYFVFVPTFADENFHQ
jgi:hypothetical protein